GTDLDEIVGYVPRHKVVGRRRVCLKELLHRPENQRSGKLVAGRADGLILPFLRIHRQGITRGVAAKRVSDKSGTRRPGRGGVIDLAAEIRACVAEVASDFGGRRHVREGRGRLAVTPAIVAKGKEGPVLDDWSAHDR